MRSLSDTDDDRQGKWTHKIASKDIEYRYRMYNTEGPYIPVK